MFKSIIIGIISLITAFVAITACSNGSSHEQKPNLKEKQGEAIAIFTVLNNTASAHRYDPKIRKTMLDGMKIANNLPTSDEKFKFASAITEAIIIHDTVNKERSSELELIEKKEVQMQNIGIYKLTYSIERKLNRGVQLIEPFLKSHNKKIKTCAEHTVKAFKSELYSNALIRSPNVSEIKCQLAFSKSLDDFEQQAESVVDFFKSCQGS